MDIKKPFVVGAGIMGAGIGQLCAQKGLDVIVSDITDEVVGKARDKMSRGLQKRIEKGKITQEDMDKMKMWRRLKFDVMFVGDDWMDTPEWQQFETDFKANGVEIIFFPYFKGTSSTKINHILDRHGMPD